MSITVDSNELVTPSAPGQTNTQPGTGVAVLRGRFPPRRVETSWHHTTQALDEVLQRLDSRPFRADNDKTRQHRLRGAEKILRWMATFGGITWQQRWLASGQEQSSGADWARLPSDWLVGRGESANAGVLSSGLFILICADVIRPSLSWLTSRRSRQLTSGIARYRDFDGFTRLDRVITAG